MHKCNQCELQFDSPQKLGGHKGSHNRGEEYRAKRGGKKNKCIECGAETKNPKYCSMPCFYAKHLKPPVVIRGHVLDITKGQLVEYREVQLTCEICGREETTCSSRYEDRVNKLSIDHDHDTLKFRGLLCSVCNRQLGWYEKNKHQIETYLQKHGPLA